MRAIAVAVATLAVLASCLLLGPQRSIAEDPPDPKRAAERRERATQVSQLAQAGKPEDAMAALRVLIELERQVLGAESVDVADSLSWLSELHWQAGQFDESRAVGREALELYKQLYGEKNWRVAAQQAALAAVDKYAAVPPEDLWQMVDAQRQNLRLLRENKLLEAREFADRLLTLRSKLLGSDHYLTAEALWNLARIRLATGDATGVDEQLRQVMRIAGQALGTRSKLYVDALDYLARYYDTIGDVQQAEELYTQVVALRGEVLGEDDCDWAVSLNNLGVFLENQEKYAAAEDYYRRAVAAHRRARNLDPDELRLSLANLARVLFARVDQQLQADDLKSAAPLAADALAVRRELYGEDHWATIDARASVDLVARLAELSPEARRELRAAEALQEEGVALEAQRRSDAALPKTEAALAIFERILGPEDPALAPTVNRRANQLYDLARYEECLADYERAERLARVGLGPRHPMVGVLMGNRANPLADLGRGDEAIALLNDAVELLDAALVDESYDYDRDFTTILASLAQKHLAAGDFARAEPLFRRALERLKPARLSDPHSYAVVLCDLGATLRLQRNFAHAEPLLQESLQVSRDSGLTESADFGLRLNGLATLYDDMGRRDRAVPLYEEALDVLRRCEETRTTEYANVADNLGQAYSQAGDYFLAEALLIEALEIRRQTLGETAYDYRKSLEHVGDLYIRRGEPRRAAALLDEAAHRAQEVGGESDIEYGVRLKDLGVLYSSLGETDRGVETLCKSLDICRLAAIRDPPVSNAQAKQAADCLGILVEQFAAREDYDHALVAAAHQVVLLQALHGRDDWRAINARLRGDELALWRRLAPAERREIQMARAQCDQAAELNAAGRLTEALGLAEQAVAVYERLDGPDSPATLDRGDVRALILRELGRLAESLGHWERAVEVRCRALGSHHPTYRNSLLNLGVTLRRLGHFGRCEQVYQEALEITRQVNGELHLDYATVLNNLSVLYQDMADYPRALDHARRSAAIYAQLVGEDHVDFANALLSIGAVYFEMHDYVRALPIFRRHQEILAHRYGTNHPEYLDSKYNLALLMHEARMYDEAEVELLACRDAWEKLAGKETPQYALALNALGNLYAVRDQYDRALPFYEEALAIRRQLYGVRGPLAVQMLSNLARCNYWLGRYEVAEPQLAEALQIREEILPPGHPHIATTRATLAELYYATDRKREALAFADATADDDQRTLESVVTFSSEETLQAFLESIELRHNKLLAMAAGMSDDPAAAELALRWTLARKAVVLDALCNLRTAQRLYELKPDVAAGARHVRALRDQIAAEAVSPPASLSAQQLRDRRAALERQLFEAEEALRRTLVDLGAASPVARPALGELRRHLPPGTALVEFVWIPLEDFRAAAGNQRKLPPHYFALVLTSRPEDGVRMIDLGEAAAIDTLIRRLRDHLTGFTAELALATEADLEQNYRQAAAALARRIFEPLLSASGGATKFYLALDGQLHLVPFGALIDRDGRYLIESYEVALLSSGRDLLRDVPAPGVGAVVFAGPNYDLGASDRSNVWQQLRRDETQPVGVAVRSGTPVDVRGLRWSPLAGAAAEAEDVRLALAGSGFAPVQSYSGDRALEEIFKDLRSPRLLHVATHGYFLPRRVDREPAADGEFERGQRGLSGLRENASALLRAGIVLAGANDLAEAPGVDDGWVTAEEISQMDLRRTELVVLSACETGLGDVETGEGVSGLRRALIHAGAQALVTSLFAVPDTDTRELMGRFYRHLAAGDPKLASLRQAQLEVLAHRREQHGAAHPFFWAGFIYVGRL